MCWTFVVTKGNWVHFRNAVYLSQLSTGLWSYVRLTLLQVYGVLVFFNNFNNLPCVWNNWLLRCWGSEELGVPWQDLTNQLVLVMSIYHKNALSPPCCSGSWVVSASIHPVTPTFSVLKTCVMKCYNFMKCCWSPVSGFTFLPPHLPTWLYKLL